MQIVQPYGSGFPQSDGCRQVRQMGGGREIREREREQRGSKGDRRKRKGERYGIKMRAKREGEKKGKRESR